MRILLLGPIHREIEFLKQKEKTPFLKGQGQQSWVEALERLGHKVFVFRYTDSVLFPNTVRGLFSESFERLIPLWKARYNRFKSAYYWLSFENYLRNKKLLLISEESKPQLVIISGGVSSIYPETLNRIKDSNGCSVLLFSGVNPLVSSTSIERTLVEKGIVDIVVENDRGYAKLWEESGAKKIIVLPISSVDPSLHRKVQLNKEDKDKYGSDVCFVGSLTNERQEMLKRVQHDNREIDIKIWGDIPLGLKLDKELVSYYHGKAYGKKMVKIFNAAKIVLNFQPEDMTNGGNMRTFEIPGCGAFQLANRVDSKWFEEGREVVSFSSINDLKKKMSFYLKNEKKRNEIAENGYIRAHKEHTYDKHFEKLLSQI